MRLALGTVQFGVDYGVANTRGRVPIDEVAAILTEAHAAGCDTLDTAVAYGDAERVLGAIGVDGWKVVTKLPAVPDDEADVAGWVTRTLRGSLERLRVPWVHGVLLHRPQQLLGPRGRAISAALRHLQAAGLTTKIGVSAGSADECMAVMELPGFSPAVTAGLKPGCSDSNLLVQVPFNLFDRRLLADGRLDRLVQAGVEVHVRSVFLQGLLLMPPSQRPASFGRWSAQLQQFDAWLAATGMTPVAACVRDALAQSGIARVVVGVDGLAHWREILQAAAGPAPVRTSVLDNPDPDLINPVTWPTYA